MFGFDAPSQQGALQGMKRFTLNDEIERKLFGDIDTRGSRAVKAFAGTDIAAWHEHFGPFFEYIDIQKLRTPKGLAWLRAQYA